METKYNHHTLLAPTTIDQLNTPWHIPEKMMIDKRIDMQETVHEVNEQKNNILHLPQLDMMTQYGSMWLFGIFSACLPVLKCVEESSTIKEPELQENLIRGTNNLMLAPQFPLMVITDVHASTTPTEMQALSNITTNIKTHTDLEEANSETQQVERWASESEASPNPFQTFASSSSGSIAENLTSMSWTPELHDRFVEAFNQLGGSKKATPSGILNLMKVEGLTIDHVESHLQEFLSQQQRHLPTQGSYESSQEEEFETKSSQTEETPLRVAIDNTGDIDINEALKIQMEVQKQLHEHLEMQRKLQMRIQEQGKYLKKMIEQQQHITVDQSRASSLSSFSSNSYDDCIKERTGQTRDYDKQDNML